MKIKKGDHLIFSKKNNKDRYYIFLCTSEPHRKRYLFSIDVKFVFSSKGDGMFIFNFYFREDGTLDFNDHTFNLKTIEC